MKFEEIDIEKIDEKTKKKIETIIDSVNQKEEQIIKSLKEIGKKNYPDDIYEDIYENDRIRIKYIRTNVRGITTITYNHKLIPYSTNKIGTEEYLHGDLKAPVEYMNLEEFIQFIDKFEEFIQEFNEYIEQMKNKIHKIDISTIE